MEREEIGQILEALRSLNEGVKTLNEQMRQVVATVRVTREAQVAHGKEFENLKQRFEQHLRDGTPLPEMVGVVVP